MSRLVAQIERLETQAELAASDQEARLDALKYYRGENTNPAPEGRSQYVSRDVADTIEGVKPAILKLFLSGDEVVKVLPIGPEDEAAANQESAYLQHIVLTKGSPTQWMANWLHDGLLQRNGYVIADWEEVEDTTTERYRGLSDEEFALLMQDTETEVVEHEESTEYIRNPLGQIMGQIRVHNVALKRVNKLERVAIRNIAPENVLVDSTWDRVSLEGCNFVCRREFKTVTELRQMGFDVPDDISDTGSGTSDDESYDYRNPSGSEALTDDGEDDPSMRRVKVREVWVRTGLDEDDNESDIAVLRHIIVVGTTILLNEEAEFIPVVAWSPMPQPHQHYGLGYWDMTQDIQDFKSAMIRGALDAVYLSNSPRFGINQNTVNLDDMLVSRPGGIVRINGVPAENVMPMVTPATNAPALQMAEYFDSVREIRTGVTRYNQGQLDPNSLNKTATGISMIMGQSQLRMELVSRHFADGMRTLFQIVHALTLKHARKPEIMRLRNQFVAVDPRTWRKRQDMEVVVGLGNGNKVEQNQYLMQMLNLMFGPAMQMGLTEPTKVYNALSRLSQNAGFKAPELFWNDPAQRPPPPSPPPPQVQAEQMRGQITMQVEQAKAQTAMQVKSAELQQQSQSDTTQAQLQLYLEQMRANQEAQLEAAKLAFEKWKAELDAQVELQKAGIQAQTARNNRIGASLRNGDPLEDVVRGESERLEDEQESLAEAMMAGINQLAETQRQQMEMLAQMIAMSSAPKMVVRDENGKIVGVQPKLQ